jgi:hypothetical protein
MSSHPTTAETRAALSATEGHVVLAEFFEEVPPLLGRPGMGMKLTTWYRKRGVDDNTPDDLANAVAHAAANELAAGPGRAHEAEPVHLPSLVPGVCLGEGGRVEPWRVGTVQVRRGGRQGCAGQGLLLQWSSWQVRIQVAIP